MFRVFDSLNLLGDLVKVTPSSKVVGDMALFMAANGLSAQQVAERAGELSFPTSVKSLLRGELGQTPGGFPPALQRAVLRGEPPIDGRPGAGLAPVDWEATRTELETKAGGAVREVDVLSYALYPEVTLDYLRHRRRFHRVDLLPTPAFLFGLQVEEDLTVEIEPGKALDVRLLNISKP